MFSSSASQVSTAANYIEDVFSTYLYTGNGATRTITNGIDLSTYGGLVWVKCRSTANDHLLYDTSRGANNALITNSTSGTGGGPNQLTSFTTAGFTLGSDGAVNSPNRNLATYVSWTFRKQAKFFDIVTYTGNGANGSAYNISHNLTVKPGFVIIKRTGLTGDWAALARVDANSTSLLNLNTTSSGNANNWLRDSTTTTTFDVGTSSFIATNYNINGATYVAYLFAHDAGGFGASGSDNVISCGSFTGSNVSNVTVSLGYEPQFILWKTTTSVDSWKIADNMRGMPIGSGSSSSTANLFPNASTAETVQNGVAPTATGFTWYANGAVAASDTYIYIAIRRGPMKTPTSGTSVFSIGSVANGSSAQRFTENFFDMDVHRTLSSTTDDWRWADKLRGITSIVGGNGQYLASNSTAAEVTLTDSTANKTSSLGVSGFDNKIRAYLYTGQGGVQYGFLRAPGFFDVVCYTGTGVARTVSHNLGVAPELMIVKPRSNSSTEWNVYAAPLGPTKYIYLQGNSAASTGVNRWNDTAPTSSVFTVATDTSVNGSGYTLVAYLFATVAGVSKVGSYTGTAALQTINCGFSAGARFVLIKRTDSGSTGDWYVWDSARGISSGNDPYLLLNSTAAEVTGTNYVDTTSVGFQVTAAAPAALNASGGTYIFLAIA